VLAKVVKSEEKKQKQKQKEERKGGRKVQVEAEAEEPIILYNAQTCTEFHKFLVAILFAYGYALADFSTSVNRQLAFKIQREKAIKFWDIAIMLWKTAHSQILEQHLTALQLAGSLSLPTFSDRDTYEAFFDWKEGGQGKGKEKGKGQVKDVIDGYGGEEDDIALEVGKQYSPGQLHAGKAVAYRRLIRLLAGHFISLDTLSKYCSRSRNPSVKISLLAVQHPGSKDIMDWLSVVRKLGSHPRLGAAQLPTDANLDIERAIKVLQEYIGPIVTNSSAGTDMNPSKDRSICNVFYCGPTSMYSGDMHPEAVLASAREYPDLITMDRAYLNRLAVRCQLY
jgi:hypothetical protein